MDHELPWLDNLQAATAVDVAAQNGFLDAVDAADLSATCPPLLIALLVAADVLQRDTRAPFRFTVEFAKAWARDADGIKARASFIRRASADIATNLEDMVFNLPLFMQKSQTFALFRYDKALTVTPENLAATRQWVRYVEALSRSEAPYLTPLIPVHSGDRILEIGGNTGLISQALIAANAGLQSTVFDLPVVCALGQERGQIPGLTFHAGDARADQALAGFKGKIDAVLFKSVLHDWPDADAEKMVAAALSVLPVGGRIIVCERGAFSDMDAAVKNINTLTNLVFSPFYRSPGFYVDLMERAGLVVTQNSVDLDMTFHITTGVRNG